MAERTEISFEVDPAETRVLDGYCGMWHVGSSKKDTSKKSK